MRPYLLVSGDFSLRGGMDRANHALASFLAEQGRQVHLVAHAVEADLAGRQNVTWHRVPRPMGSCFLGEPLLDRVGRYWARRMTARGGRVVVNGGNCQWGDVNWVHYVHAAGGAGGGQGWKARLYAHRERRALSRARLIIANSQRTRSDLVDRVGVAPERVETVYLGVDGEAFCPPGEAERQGVRRRMGWADNSAVVGFVGALGDRRKGFDTLFEAWKRLGSAGRWEAELVVMGAGAELEAWKARAREAGMTSIHFLGFREDVAAILKGCDVVVAPTRYEPYGLGVHEALCCGVPALVSAQAGVAERYPEALKELLVLNPDDAGELAERLGRWSANREDYRSRVRPLGDQLRAGSWAAMGQRMVELMEASRDMECGQR